MEMISGKVYIAGGLFTSGERAYLEEIDRICREVGFDTYLPHRDAGLASDSASREYVFVKDKAILNKAILVVAVLNGPDVDSGTAWEIGYAFGLGVPILGISDDKRYLQTPQSINPMLYYSLELCTTQVELREKLVRYKTSPSR